MRLCSGSDLTILAIGKTVFPALAAAQLLQQRGVSAAVVNGRFVKPLDEDLLCSLAQSTGRVLTVEENMLAGGFGSAVLELFEQRDLRGIRARRIGIPDQFVEHGAPALLRQKYGLDAEGIYAAACTLLETDARRVSFPAVVAGRQARRV